MEYMVEVLINKDSLLEKSTNYHIISLYQQKKRATQPKIKEMELLVSTYY